MSALVITPGSTAGSVIIASGPAGRLSAAQANATSSQRRNASPTAG
jgi:hypothetical protein